jgi:subtilisin family serine protease
MSNMKFFTLLLLLLATTASSDPKVLKVAVVDTGLDINDPRVSSHICPSGSKDFTGEGLKDSNTHGTHVAGLIIKYAGNTNYCLLIYKYYRPIDPGKVSQRHELDALIQAVNDGADIVNLSGGGPNFNEEERLLILNHPQVTFVVAAGNDGLNLDISGNEYYPANYDLPNIIPVMNITSYGIRLSSSNYGKHVLAKEIGYTVLSLAPPFVCKGDLNCTDYKTGTSMSTAIHTGKLIKERLNAR